MRLTQNQAAASRAGSSPAGGTNHLKYIQRHFANGGRSRLPFSKCCSKCWLGGRSSKEHIDEKDTRRNGTVYDLVFSPDPARKFI